MSRDGHRIGGMLLAAGASRRMGSLKQLLPWGPVTVLEQGLRTFREADACPIIVVLGFAADEIGDRLSDAFDVPDVRVVVNDRHEEGMVTSVQCGMLGAHDAGLDAVALALVDQPFIPPSVFRTVLGAYRRTGRLAIVPTVAGKRGHPIVLSMALQSDVLAIGADGGGLRELIRARDHDVLLVPVDVAEIARDMDVPEEYRRERDTWLATSGANKNGTDSQ